ncbi:MAG: hypothetical protein HY907_05620 [Deltaproteobacteria bacterium]|nr:hypothetical protein [Deltaproteobacteria bacterium]
MRFSAWIALSSVWLAAAPALAGVDEAGKQIVISGGVSAPPPPTVIVSTPAPPTVVVTPVAPQPVYVQPPPVYVQPQPVYAPPQPVYAIEAPPQPEEDTTFALTVNPLFFFFGNVQAKVGVADWVALAGQFDYMYINFFGWKMWMLGVLVGVDFFFTGRAPEGPFLGPRIGFDHFNWTDGNGGVEVIRAGLAGGYQWVWDSGFALLIGGSFTYIADIAKKDESFDSWILGIPIPTFDIAIGFGS